MDNNNFVPQVYNPAPGNPSTAGQVSTPSSIVRPSRGRAATEIVMPDSSDEARAAAGVRVGSLTVVRGSGFRPTVEVLTAEGQTLRDGVALTALYEALMAELRAERA